MVKSIPMALAEFSQWLCYKLVDKGGARKGKPPVSPKTGVICAKNDESQFTTLNRALEGCETYDLDGVGFVFANGFVAIDLDDCFCSDGTLTDVAQDIYDHFSDSYVEYSPSGNGLHIFVRGEKPNDRTKDSALGIEVYSGYNFVTVTGDHIEGTGHDVIDMQDELDWLFDTYLPDTKMLQKTDVIVDHGGKTPQEWLDLALAKDARLNALYNNVDHSGDESSMDMSLLMKLAYWLNRDHNAVVDAFLASPWAKSKDAAHQKKLDRKDYLETSALRSVQMVTATAVDSDRQFKARADSFLSLRTDTDGELKVELDAYTDHSNAKVMSHVYNDIMCWTSAWGWCYYNGTTWETDADWRAVTCAITIGEALLKSAEEWMAQIAVVCEDREIDPESQEGKRLMRPASELYRHAIYTLSNKGINALVSIAKALMICDASTFDSNPWLLNTPEFAVDLSTGERIPHSARHMCTSCASMSPTLDPEEAPKTPMFDEFLSQIFCDDKELIDYMQLQVGSMLVGKVYNENLIIANGGGSNGKSTLFGVIQAIMGDYATAIDPELLMSSRVNEQQVGMAMLRGRRLAVAQETEAGQTLRTSMLKRLVSTDKMVAKRLYHDPMEFTPTHTLVLATNHLPTVSANDAGTWRRIVVVPFNATIDAKDMIADFQAVLLRNEGEGIMNWMIDGAVRFCEANCILSDKPTAVIEASLEYRVAEDWYTSFHDECLNDGGWVWHTDLYNVYAKWSRHSNEKTMSTNAFSRALTTAGVKRDAKRYNKVTKKTEKAWLGIHIREDLEEKTGIKFKGQSHGQ